MYTPDFHKKLKLKPDGNYQFKINDNVSTMVSVKCNPERNNISVSLHRMFLDAPQNIMDELSCYIVKQEEEISPKVRAYIEDNLKLYDYSHTIDKKKLHTEGCVYDLKNFYDEINQKYFSDSLKLLITWFGKRFQRNRTRVTFGLYHDAMRLIKINRMMDDSSFPEYVVKFVVYHEMLHHVCPSYFDEKGIHRVHSKEFKKLEEKYEHFDLANSWIIQNQNNLFTC